MQCKVEICGINTSKLKVLKNEEMLELMKRMRQGTTGPGSSSLRETCAWSCL